MHGHLDEPLGARRAQGQRGRVFLWVEELDGHPVGGDALGPEVLDDLLHALLIEAATQETLNPCNAAPETAFDPGR